MNRNKDFAANYAALDGLFDAIKTREDAFAATGHAATALGFPYLIHAPVRNHPDADKNWSATTYPEEWKQLYIAKNYLSRNPIRHRTLVASQPFRWSTLELELPKKDRAIFSDSRSIGMEEGVVVPIHGPWGQTIAIGFACPHEDAADDGTMRALQIIALRLHHTYDRERVEEIVRLTLREREILLRVAEGRENGDIANLLSIADSSVEWHLKNIYDKLGVRNRTAAVVKAIQIGLLAL